MQVAYTPFMWPFVVSLSITAWLGLYAYRQRHLPAAATFALLMFALTLWTVCYLLELLSVTLEAKLFWASAKYIGGTMGPAIFFVLALRLTNHEHWLTPTIQILLHAFVIVTCVVVFTNDVHHWYWTNVFLVDGFPESHATHGFFFWIYAVMLYVFVLISVVLFFGYYRSTPALYRRQATLMALGGFVPLGGRLLEDVFKIDVFPKVDNVILLFLLSGLLFAGAIFRYRAFHIVHIAHNLVIENIQAGIIVLDMFERIVDLNPYARAVLRPAHTGIIGQPLQDVWADWPQAALAPDGEHEVAIRTAAGERWFQIQRSTIVAENHAAAGFSVVLFDVTARKLAEHKLAALAQTDPLTGVTNRRHFYELAEARLAQTRRYQRPGAVVMLDIDHFKAINDTYGHLAGDDVIRSVADQLRHLLRATDLLARYGGEEFICLLDEVDVDEARATAERMRQAIADARVTVADHSIQLTISIGIAPLLRAGPALSALIGQADQALYTSKANGRNRVSTYAAEQQPLAYDQAHAGDGTVPRGEPFRLMPA